MAVWTNIENGEVLLSIRDKLNNFNASVVSSLSTLVNTTATNTANIFTNTSNIATNTNDISTNTADLVTNTAAITSVEEDVLLVAEEISALKSAETGFDLRDTSTLGILELCPVANDNMYWRIDEDNNFSTITGATTFGDGTTPLTDRTICHRPVGAELSFYIDGDKIVKTTAQTLQLENVAIKQIITYSRDTQELHQANTIYEAIRDDAIVAVVTGNPSLQQRVIFANERHGKEMSSATHMMLHETDGAKFGNGLTLSGLANNGNTFTSISSGTVWDEDLEHHILAVTSAPFAYRDTQGYWALETSGGNVIATNELAFTNGTSADSLYNRDNGDGSWSLVDTGSDYVVNHIFATNDGEYPIFKVVGQALYPDRTTARNHLAGEMARFQEGDLPSPEFLHMYSYILDGNGNIETGLDGEIYVDFKLVYPIARY